MQSEIIVARIFGRMVAIHTRFVCGIQVVGENLLVSAVRHQHVLIGADCDGANPQWILVLASESQGVEVFVGVASGERLRLGGGVREG